MKPLAHSVRPEKISDVLGQKHLIGENKVLSNLVNNKKIFSMILFGPPGTGKTTLAYAIINELNLPFGFLNAVINNKKDFEEMVYKAKENYNFILIIY